MVKSIFEIALAIRLKVFMLAVIAGAFIFPPVNAAEKTDTTRISSARESIFGEKANLEKSHFTWGVDLGASIDLTGNDMSTFDLDFILGYKNKLFKTAGIGIGIHRSVQQGDNFIPLYALIRTSFTSRPSLLFFNARVGYSFNTVEDSPMFGDFNSAFGCGINLYQSRKAKSYIILNAAYRYFSKRHQSYISRLNSNYIWIAQLQFGVNF